jgi:hypothetical protein
VTQFETLSNSNQFPANWRESYGTRRDDGTNGPTVTANTAASSALPHSQYYYVLTHDFLNYVSGRLDPSIAAIARAASLAESTVYLALKRLKLLGLLNWTRRCREDRDETGQFRLRQDTNAYRVLPHSEWLGYRDDAAPPPTKDTLGYPEPVTSPIESAASMVKAQQPASVYRELTLDPKNELALALASFGRAAGFI